jgi:mono/diheme cytochrome c family protein
MTTRGAWLAIVGVVVATALPCETVRAADAATFTEVFAARCESCHGMDGSSDTPSARALKVSPLLADERLAAMTPAEIVDEIRTNPKHRGVIDFAAISSAELLAAAEYVRRLCAGR